MRIVAFPVLLLATSTGCAISLRAVPSVTVDTHGKPGGQGIVGFGFAISGENGRGLVFGVEGGAQGSNSSPSVQAIVEAVGDFFLIPTQFQPGPAMRVGARLGLRPSTFPTYTKVLFAPGAAIAALYRITGKLGHFVGLEARCEAVLPMSDGPPSPFGICAFGPAYELWIPFWEGGGLR